MLYQIETKKSISEIEKSLGTISARHKFGLLTIHNLKEKMNEKGVPFKKDCLIFEVCNPQQAQKILDGNMDISNLLPCRIAAYQCFPTRSLRKSPRKWNGFFFQLLMRRGVERKILDASKD